MMVQRYNFSGNIQEFKAGAFDALTSNSTLRYDVRPTDVAGQEMSLQPANGRWVKRPSTVTGRQAACLDLIDPTSQKHLFCLDLVHLHYDLPCDWQIRLESKKVKGVHLGSDAEKAYLLACTDMPGWLFFEVKPYQSRKFRQICTISYIDRPGHPDYQKGNAMPVGKLLFDTVPGVQQYNEFENPARLELANALFYSGQVEAMLKELMYKLPGYHSPSRLDIAYDAAGILEKIEDVTEMQQVSRKLNVQPIKLTGKTQMRLHGTQNNTGYTFGSRNSAAFVRVYNKTAEIKAGGWKKDYIHRAHLRAGLIGGSTKDADVHRLEVSLGRSAIVESMERTGSGYQLRTGYDGWRQLLAMLKKYAYGWAIDFVERVVNWRVGKKRGSAGKYVSMWDAGAIKRARRLLKMDFGVKRAIRSAGISAQSARVSIGNCVKKAAHALQRGFTERARQYIWNARKWECLAGLDFSQAVEKRIRNGPKYGDFAETHASELREIARVMAAVRVKAALENAGDLYY
jgi:hypothetical protein